MAGGRQTRILFFGRLADSFGKERMLTIPEEGWTVGQLREALCASHPPPSGGLDGSRVRLAVDQEIAGEDRRVYPGQEIAFLSPLSGG